MGKAESIRKAVERQEAEDDGQGGHEAGAHALNGGGAGGCVQG